MSMASFRVNASKHKYIPEANQTTIHHDRRTLELKAEEPPVPVVQRVGHEPDQLHLRVSPDPRRGERPYRVAQFLRETT